MTMRKAEYEQRIANYSRRLGERERSALAGSAAWISLRAWRRDRLEGIVAPCPACGAELAMLHDEVLVAGLCPRCGERAISDAV